MTGYNLQSGGVLVVRLIVVMMVLSVPSFLTPDADGADGPTSNIGGRNASKSLRLAVVSSDASVNGAADLLMAKLSINTSLALLERDQISKAFQEQALSAGGRRDYLKLGRILGADGLLLLEPFKRGENERLGVRLVAVNAGVVLSWMEYPLPLPDAAVWSRVASDHFTGQLVKLKVLPQNVVPISILNLRSSVSTAESAAMERELTLLLAHRLSHEKDIVVLERRKMDALDREKHFEGLEQAGFWEGGYLLDGTLDKDGVKQGRVSLNVRLTPPRGGQPVLIEVVGDRKQLPGLVGEVSSKIVSALQLKPEAVAWSPLEEAARYYEEARLALTWKMYPEAQAAADAAWALGLRSRKLATLHIRCFGEEPQHPPGVFPDSFSRMETLARTPEIRFVDSGIRALALYLQASHDPTLSGGHDSEWFDLGRAQLETVALTLRDFWADTEHNIVDAPRLAELRAHARAVADALESFPDGKKKMLPLRCYQGPYFQDSPEQCVQLFKQLIESGDYRRLPYKNYEAKWKPMPIIGWSFQERHQARILYPEMLESLGKSTQPTVRLEAAIWAAEQITNEYEAEEKYPALMDRFWTDRDRLFSGEIPPDVLKRFETAVMASRDGATSKGYEAFKKRAVIPFLAKLKEAQSDYAATSKAHADQKMAEERRIKLQALQNDFRARPLIQPATLGSNYSRLALTETERREIDLAYLGYKRSWQGSSNDLLRMELKIQLNPSIRRHSGATGSDVFINSSPVQNASAPAMAPLPRQQGMESAAGPMQMNRFWHSPRHPPGTNSPRESGLSSIGYRSGRIWVEEVYSERIGYNKLGHKQVFYGIVPGTFETRVIESDQDEKPPARGKNPVFEVFQNYLVAETGGGFQKYDLNGGGWSPVRITLPPDRKLINVGGRLYCTTDDSLLELDLASDSAKVLASCRRRPAVTLLDSRDKLGQPPVCLDNSNRLLAFVGDRVYRYLPEKNDWENIGEIPFKGPWEATGVPGQPLLLKQQRSESEFLVFADREPGGDGIFRRTRIADDLADLGKTTKEIFKSELIWSTGFSRYQMASDWFPFLDASDAWVFCPNMKQVQNKKTGSTEGLVKPVLLHYRQGLGTPRLFPVQLMIPVVDGTAERLLPYENLLHHDITVFATPESLVVFSGAAGGFWYLPKADLAPVMADLDNLNLDRDRRRLEVLMSQEKRWIEMFDANNNQQLDREELEAAAKNNVYRQHQRELFELRARLGAKPLDPTKK